MAIDRATATQKAAAKGSGAVMTLPRGRRALRRQAGMRTKQMLTETTHRRTVPTAPLTPGQRTNPAVTFPRRGRPATYAETPAHHLWDCSHHYSYDCANHGQTHKDGKPAVGGWRAPAGIDAEGNAFLMGLWCGSMILPRAAHGSTPNDQSKPTVGNTTSQPKAASAYAATVSVASVAAAMSRAVTPLPLFLPFSNQQRIW